MKHKIITVFILIALFIVSTVYAADDVSLLHGNSLPVIDATGRTWTNSGATIDTVNHVFGGGSLAFNGSAFLSSPDNADSHFGDGRPVAMDFWVRLNQLPANQSKYVVYSQGTSYSSFMYVELYNDNGAMGLVIEGVNGSHAPVYAYLNSFDIGEWHHLAIQKEIGNVYRMYQNCQELDATGVFNIPYTNWSSPVYIGQFFDGGLRLRGQLDEFYLTRTVRFTGSSCTLPTSEYGAPSVTVTPSRTPTATVTRTPTATPTITNTPLSTATPTRIFISCPIGYHWIPLIPNDPRTVECVSD